MKSTCSSAAYPRPTFLEQQRAEWMAAQFRAIGWHVGDRSRRQRARLPRGRPAGSARRPDRASRYRARAPHQRRHSRSIREGDLRGPGVSDNGAGLAALLAIAKALKSIADPRHAAISGTGCCWWPTWARRAKGILRGIRHLCRPAGIDRAHRARSWFSMAPRTDHITTHALGSRRFEVAFSGLGRP